MFDWIKSLLGWRTFRHCYYRRFWGLYCGCWDWTPWPVSAWQKRECWRWVDKSKVRKPDER